MTSSAPLDRAIEILLVEDNPGDVRLAREALKDSRIRNTIHVAQDGVEALEFLRRHGRHADAPRPDLILLDLNLPRKHGREVLAEVKGDPELASIPVVVLTISRHEDDVLAGQDRRANAYFVKPIDFRQFMQVVRSIEEFWSNVVERRAGR